MSEQAKKTTLKDIVGEIAYSMDEMGYGTEKMAFARLGGEVPEDLLKEVGDSIHEYAEAHHQERIEDMSVFDLEELIRKKGKA